MKKLGPLETIVHSLRDLGPERFRQLSYLFLALAALIPLAALWNIYAKGSSLLHTIHSTQKVLKEASLLTSKNADLEEKESAYAEFITQTPLGRNLTGFLGSTFSAQGIQPTEGWQEARKIFDIPRSENFDEERVEVSFNGQNTEQIVTLMEALRKEPAVILREVDIKREGDLLSLTLLVATKRSKVGSEV